MRALGQLALAMMVIPLALGTALAAEKPSFNDADRNGDDRVSVDEAKAAGIPPAKARANDLNGDGKLTRADWRFIDLDSETDGGR